MSARFRMLRWVAASISGGMGATIGWLAGDVLVAAFVRGDVGESAVGVMLTAGATLTATAVGVVIGYVSVGAMLAREEGK